MPRALIFDMEHQLVDLYQVCLNYVPGANNGPAQGVICFTYAYVKEDMKKIFQSEATRPRALIFGM